MADYVIIPYDGGLGWLMVSRNGLSRDVGQQVSFLRKMAYSGVNQKYCMKTDKGFVVTAQYKDKLIFKSPVEAIKRLGQTMHSKPEKVGPNKFKAGSITVQVLHPNSRGTTWKFINQQ